MFWCSNVCVCVCLFIIAVFFLSFYMIPLIGASLSHICLLCLSLESPACSVWFFFSLHCLSVCLHQHHVAPSVPEHNMLLWDVPVTLVQTGPGMTGTSESSQARVKAERWGQETGGQMNCQGCTQNTAGTDCCTVGYMLCMLVRILYLTDAVSETGRFILAESWTPVLSSAVLSFKLLGFLPEVQSFRCQFNLVNFIGPVCRI